MLEDWHFISLNLLTVCLRFVFLVSGQSTETGLPNAVSSTHWNMHIWEGKEGNIICSSLKINYNTF